MRLFTLPFAITLACLPTLVAAQNGTKPENGAVKFEMLHPTFADGDRLSLASGAYFLGLSTRVSSGSGIVLELPFARSSQEFNNVSQSSSSIGNPYIGVYATYRNTRIDVGGRVPLASNEEVAVVYGFVTDQERLEAFIPDYASARVSAAFTTNNGPARAQLALGPTLLVPVGDAADGDAEVLLNYATRLLADGRRAQVVAGIEGRIIATEPGSLAERSDHQIVVGASYAFGSIRPGLSLRVPVDNEVMNNALGVSLQIALR